MKSPAHIFSIEGSEYMSQKKIFIAGATGTLGIPLVRELIARGYSITGLTRSPSKQSLLEQLGAAAVVVDALDGQALENALRSTSPDWVVHLLTALPKNAPTRYAHMSATNILRIQGTENLIRAAVAAGAQRIVGESMIFAYGFGDHGDQAKVESDPLQPRELNAELQAIADALRSLENQLLAANRQGSIEAIPLRYGLFYGPESPSTRYMLTMLKKHIFPVPAGSQELLSWIHTDDAVHATVAALEKGRPGEIYNIVDNCPVSLKDWASFAAEQMHVSHPYAIPKGIIQFLMPYVAAFSSTRLPVSNGKAKRELSWQPLFPSYKEGLQSIRLMQ